MGALGELLELLHGASDSYRTFRGEFRVLEQPEVAQQALEAWRERSPRRTRVSGGGARSMSGSFFLWDDPAESGVPNTLDESFVRVSAQTPGRYREESGAGEDLSLVVRDGPRWWSYDSFLGRQSNEHEKEPSSSTVAGRCEGLLAPAPLMGLLRFEPAGTGERAGRPVLHVAARPRERLDLPGLSLARGADEYELEVDAERGVILRVDAKFGGQELSVVEAREVAYDEALPEDAFVFTVPAR